MDTRRAVEWVKSRHMRFWFQRVVSQWTGHLEKQCMPSNSVCKQMLGVWDYHIHTTIYKIDN